MIYAYIRVSTKHQNIDRQFEEIKALGIDDKYIYIDKESGKDFDRTKYQKLIKKLKKDDLLIIKSIDRLGRNYHMILEEWARITKTIGADIKVLKQRQAEGIRIAKEKGVKFGRPKSTLPPNTNDILDKYINKELTNLEAAKLIGVSRGTFFRLVKDRKL